MQPPVKGFVTMGLDPGYRNGCKVAVVDATGKVLDTSVVLATSMERSAAPEGVEAKEWDLNGKKITIAIQKA